MRKRWVAVARGDASADLVLTGGYVLSVFTGEVFAANVAICDGHVVGVGDYHGPVEYRADGFFLVPGFIDGHCHVESSKLNVDEFARAILPRGTTTVVVDPHELANVLGTRGIEFMLEASKGVPLGVYVMLPSCVPASPLETAAAPLDASDYADLLRRQRVLGIAEMMNFPGAIAGETTILDKMALTDFRHVDGHAPGVSGRELNAYIVSGPSSDHECTGLEEALEKKRLGMWIMIREASMIRNLDALLPLVRDYGTDNCMFVTDDREAGTLMDEGHMNAIVRKAVQRGISAGDAIKLATLNVARYHGLVSLGAIAPGYAADILVLPDLSSFEPKAVFKNGRLVAEAGRAYSFTSPQIPDYVLGTVRARPVSASDFGIRQVEEPAVRVVELIPDQVVTKSAAAAPRREGEWLVADVDRDLAKVAVVERHHGSGRIGLGFVRGFGLTSGAFASTVAHDAHNIVVVGVDDESMATCVNRLAQTGGGLAVAHGSEIRGELPLEIAGLMSTKDAATVAAGLGSLEETLTDLGVVLATPFMYLSFLALSVIPELRVTDRGVVDVGRFEVVPLGVA